MHYTEKRFNDELTARDILFINSLVKYKYETYNDLGFRQINKQPEGETDIIFLSHLLMEEHLKKTCLRQVFF